MSGEWLEARQLLRDAVNTQLQVGQSNGICNVVDAAGSIYLYQT